MRKVFSLFLCIFALLFSLSAEETSKSYWEKEIDVDGQLMTYYFTKTDEGLEDNILYFIKSISGITNQFLLPNTVTMRKQMVSEEYLEKNFPNLYKTMFHLERNDTGLDWSEYNYCFSGMSLSSRETMFVLFKKLNDKIYFSLTVTEDGGFKWLYTNQTLEIMDKLLKDR